jgi:hypothetical protein
LLVGREDLEDGKIRNGEIKDDKEDIEIAIAKNSFSIMQIAARFRSILRI